MALTIQEEQTAECRRCTSYCDMLIDPGACSSLGCRYLYAYIDEDSARKYMGCLQRVFKAEVDVERYVQLNAGGRRVFNGLRAARQPLSHCPFAVERAFSWAGSQDDVCANLRFYDCADTGPGSFSMRDLREVLRPS